jgi:hypothetical protein
MASLSGPLRTGSRSGWPVHSPGTPRPTLPPSASAHRPSLHGPGPTRGLTRLHHAPQRTPPARPGPRPVHDAHHVPLYTSDRRPGPRVAPDLTRTRHIPFPRNGPCSGTRWSSRLHVGKGEGLPRTRARRQLWTCCSGTQQAQDRTSDLATVWRRGSYLAYGKPLAGLAHHQLPRNPLELREGTRRGESSAGGEGLPQTTPLLSGRG